MRLRREIEHARRALDPHDDVLGVVLADGHIGIGQVGNVQHHRIECRLRGIDLRFERGASFTDHATPLDERLPCSDIVCAAHLFGERIPLCLQLLQLVLQIAPLLVELTRGVNHRGIGIELLELTFDKIRLVADQPQIEHHILFLCCGQPVTTRRIQAVSIA